MKDRREAGVGGACGVEGETRLTNNAKAVPACILMSQVIYAGHLPNYLFPANV